MNSSKKQITVTVLVVLGMAFLAGGIFALSRLIEDAKFNKEFEQIDTVNIELEAIRTSDDYQEKDVEAKAEIMMNALEEQAKAGNIIENSIAYDEENSVITYYYSCGMLGIENFDQSDGFLSGTTNGDASSSQDFENNQADILLITALDHNEQQKDDNPGYWLLNDMYDELKEKGVNVRFDNTLTLDDVANLKGYSFVYFLAHGTAVSDIEMTFMKTNEKYNEETQRKYEDDYEKGIIYRGHSLEVVKQGGEIIALENGVYCFTSSFFTKHYNEGNLSKCNFYFATCNLLGGDILENFDNVAWPVALSSVSASSMVGFYNIVDQKYGVNFGKVYLYSLLEGKTAGEAFDCAKKQCGNDYAEYKYNSFKYHLPGESYETCAKKLKSENAKPYFFGNENAKLTINNTSSTSPSTAKESLTETTTTLSETETSAPTPTPPVDVRIDAENFPDDVFREFVANRYDLDSDGVLSKDEIAEVTVMGVSDVDYEYECATGFDIENFKGIEFFTELETLRIYLNRTIKILDISQNPKLELADLTDCADPEQVTMRVGQTFNVDFAGSTDCKSSDPNVVVVSPLFKHQDFSRKAKFTALNPGESMLYYIPRAMSFYVDDRVNYDNPFCKVTVIDKFLYDMADYRAVVVTDAVDESFCFNYLTNQVTDRKDRNSIEIAHTIPMVAITGMNMDSVNEKIMSDALEYTGKTYCSEYPRPEINYKYYIDEKIISICLYVKLSPIDAWDRSFYVYNISVETGEFLGPSDVVSLCDYTDEEFFELVEEEYLLLYVEWTNRFSGNAYVEQLATNNYQRISYEYIKPFIYDAGDCAHLCYIGFIEVPGDPEQGDFLFDTYNHKKYTFLFN